MRYKFVLFLCFSQLIYSQVIFEKSPYEKNYNAEKKLIAENWENYLNSFTESNYGDCKYWKTSDLNKVGCNLLETQGFYNPSLFKLPFKNQILNIVKITDRTYELSSIFYMIKENLEFNPFAIIKIPVEKIGEDYYFKDNLDIIAREWESKEVGIIRYHFPSDYKFNDVQAALAAKFVDQLNKTFELNNTDSIEYFIAKNCTKVFNISGFSFAPTMDADKCAFYDSYNDIVYTTKFYGEFHKHELIHLINKKYPNAHYLLTTGLSIYNDGENVHKNYNFRTLFEKFNSFYSENPQIKLELFNLDNFNESIQIDYLIGALIVDAIAEKDGLPLLKNSLKNIKTDEELENFIKIHLMRKNEDISMWLKRRARYATAKNFKFKIDI